MKIINLSGKWRYETDEKDMGIQEKYYARKLSHNGFVLPGSTCDNKIGRRQEYYEKMTQETVRAPREKYEYIGALWLQREVEIPEDWDKKCIRLFLERVNIASDLWIDGNKIDRRIIELSGPHIFNLTNKISAGTHTLTLRIDNRDLLSLDTMSSGYSVDTQGFWNGIIGRIELQCEPVLHLENIQVYPQEDHIGIKLTIANDVHFPEQRRNVRVELQVDTPDGNALETKEYEVCLFNSKQVERFYYDLTCIQWWDEFNPALYTLNVRLICEDYVDEKHVTFGMRIIQSKNKEFILNGRPIALRGTIDCAQFPITGYPPMNIEAWRKNFSIIKSYGFNHVRFHSWCPPECAFEAADEIGLYISVEMPLWLNLEVCAFEAGDDPMHKFYFWHEAVIISKWYGNHPSFIMFSNGNEIMGDFEMLEDITMQIKAYDNRRLYTLTSNFDHPVASCEDYICAYEAGGRRVRLQHCMDKIADSTYFDYREAVNSMSVPIVSFEVGQYCVYPDVDIAKKYTGNMLPVNFDVIKKHMIKKGIYNRLGDYIKASGNLALKLYKEEIECAMRTKKFGGFELLSLCDYTGQCTATVGLLDVFYDSKGITSPEEFSHFCNSVVPLFKSKRIFTNKETIEAELDLYDYGKERIQEPVFHIKVYQEDRLFYEAETKERKVAVPLDGIHRSAILKVILSVGEYTNSWNIFVFTANDTKASVPVIKDDLSELKRIIQNGGKAIVTSDILKKPMGGNFEPVFWSPAYFPSHKACGAIIDEKHPIFDCFPTEKYPDFQWKALLDKSAGADISEFPQGFKPIIEFVPNFFDNTPFSPLFEVQVGKADVLFCGFDLYADDVAARQLAGSIFRYASSEYFKPVQKLDEKVFFDLFE